MPSFAAPAVHDRAMVEVVGFDAANPLGRTVANKHDEPFDVVNDMGELAALFAFASEQTTDTDTW